MLFSATPLHYSACSVVVGTLSGGALSPALSSFYSADISNPTKTKSVQDKWAVCVNEEFFAQGDREAQLGLPVSPGFDRKTATLPMSQINFCEFIVMPLFASLVAIFPVSSSRSI